MFSKIIYTFYELRESKSSDTKKLTLMYDPILFGVENKWIVFIIPLGLEKKVENLSDYFII